MIAGGGYEPVLEFGEVQGATASDLLNGGELLGELTDEIAAAATGIFLLVNKVYSPQYVLWLVPLAAMARPR